MPLLIPNDNRTKRWDETPKSWIWTRRYKVKTAPALGKARAIQRKAYDWALKTMHENPSLKVRAKGDSLWLRLTQARRDGTLSREHLNLQRAACNQAHTVFGMLEEHWEQRAEKALKEQDEKVTARLLRQISKPPKPVTKYLRSHPSKQHRKQAIAVLEGVQVLEDGVTVKMRGLVPSCWKKPCMSLSEARSSSRERVSSGSTPSTGKSFQSPRPSTATLPDTIRGYATP